MADALSRDDPGLGHVTAQGVEESGPSGDKQLAHLVPHQHGLVLDREDRHERKRGRAPTLRA